MFFRYSLIILIAILNSCSSKNMRKKYNYDQIEQNYYPKQYYQQYPRTPNSRAYSNPYKMPQQYLPPLYDSDQYYVAPTQYYNIETPRPSPANDKY